MNEIVKKWYVVRTYTGKENKVKQHLEKIDLQVLIPTEKEYKIKNGKKSVKDKTFYPGYILVETSMSDKIRNTIKNIQEVVEVLGSLTENEVNDLIKKEKVETEEPYIVGEIIKIIDGPFNNFNGIIKEVNQSKKRVKIEVNIFDRTTPVELEFFQIIRNK